MKKMIKSALVITALLTSAQADFSFGTMFEEISEVMSSITEDRPDTNEKSTESVTVSENASQAAKKEVTAQ